MIDPLSEVLRTVRLAGGVFLHAHFTAPWCVNSKVAPEDCAAYMPMPAQVIAYHYVIDGSLLVTVDGEAPVAVRAGEIVLLPRNDLHILGSAPGLKPVDAGDLIEPGSDGGNPQREQRPRRFVRFKCRRPVPVRANGRVPGHTRA